MSSTTTNLSDELLPEIRKFQALLQEDIHAALEFLNYRTPHRYTGVFRFDGDTLRNELLFDRKQADIRQGADVPLAATYCSLVGRQEASVTILDAADDPQAQGIATPVVSYCGVLIRDSQGKPTARSATMICNAARSARPIYRCWKRRPLCFISTFTRLVGRQQQDRNKATTPCFLPAKPWRQLPRGRVHGWDARSGPKLGA